MLLKKYILLLACLALVITSCSDDDDTAIVEVIEVTSGSADVSRYVAIGNSLTSGFTDGALFIAGQINSFPNTLSKQFSAAGGGVFTQPLMNDNIGGALLGGNQIFNPRLFFDGSGPALLPQTPTTEIANIKPGPYNNMGVPGAKSFHLLSNSYGNLGAISTGQANPYFVRMASNPSASVLQDAMAQSPTFFSIWIGNNDVLSYSSSGGDGTDQTGNPDPSTYGSNDITDPGLFANVYAGIVNGMVSSGATEGVVLNIPDVTSIPFFTTIPHNPIPLDGPTAGAINAGYAAYNGGLQAAFAVLTGTGLFTAEELAKRTINFTAGQNAVVIVDESLTDLGAINPAFNALPKLRQATANDLIVLRAATFIGTLADPNNPASVNGVGVPLADKWVLTETEIAEVTAATAAFNAAIAQVASQFGLAHIDANALMSQVATAGVPFDDFILQGNLVFGGLFSLDGVHATARGYAFIAKEILRAIDTKYGSNFEAAGAVPKAKDFGLNYPPGI